MIRALEDYPPSKFFVEQRKSHALIFLRQET